MGDVVGEIQYLSDVVQKYREIQYIGDVVTEIQRNTVHR